MIKIHKTSVFFIIALIIIFGLGYNQFIAWEQSQKEKALMVQLTKKKQQLDAWLLNKKLLIENLADILGMVEYTRETHLPLMNKTLKVMGVNSIFGGFVDGQYIDTQNYWIEGFDPRVRPWYKETIDTNDSTISGPMYYTDITGEKITWWSVSSAMHIDTVPFGVISGELLPNMMEVQLKDLDIKGVERVLLVHESSGFVVASIPQLIQNKHFHQLYPKDLYDHIKIEVSTTKVFKKATHSYRIYSYKLTEAPWILCAIIRQ